MTLSEMSQTEKKKYPMFSHIWNVDLKKKKNDMGARRGRQQEGEG
jgi:hypothetical protein